METLKDQFKIFLKVLLAFGQVYYAINILFMTEIVQGSLEKLNGHTPALVQDKMLESMGYIPGSGLELVFRISGFVLLVISLYLCWVVTRHPWPQWKLISSMSLVSLLIFYGIAQYCGVEIYIVHNAIVFLLAHSIILIRIIRDGR